MGNQVIEKVNELERAMLAADQAEMQEALGYFQKEFNRVVQPDGTMNRKSHRRIRQYRNLMRFWHRRMQSDEEE